MNVNADIFFSTVTKIDDVMSPLQTEIKAILFGLQVAKEMNLRKVQLESDYLVVVREISKKEDSLCEWCHNGFPLNLDDHKIKWSRHRSFLYRCDRSPGIQFLKLWGSEIII